MKKRITILVMLLMVLTLFTGCSKKEDPAAAKDQLDTIRENGKLVVGIEGTYKPFNFVDDDGNFAGYDVDVAKAVAEYLGVEVEFVMDDWDALLVGINAQRWDTVIADVTATDERRETYDFSDPYCFTARQVVVTPGNPLNLHSLEDLNGLKIATNATNSWVPRLEELGVTIVPIEDPNQCAQAVIKGDADFCMFNDAVLGVYLEEHPEAPLEVAFKIDSDINEVSIPCRKGEERLLAEFNAAIAELRESGKLLEFSMKWFGQDLTYNPFAE